MRADLIQRVTEDGCHKQTATNSAVKEHRAFPLTSSVTQLHITPTRESVTTSFHLSLSLTRTSARVVVSNSVPTREKGILVDDSFKRRNPLFLRVGGCDRDGATPESGGRCEVVEDPTFENRDHMTQHLKIYERFSTHAKV